MRCCRTTTRLATIAGLQWASVWTEAAIGAALRRGGIETWQEEAKWVVEHAKIHAIGDIGVLVDRRCRQRVPLQYLLGRWDFHCLTDIHVRPPVLVPRPETEGLVDLALLEAEELLRSADRLHIVDACCGSGVVGLALLRSLSESAPAAKCTATFLDIDPAAAALATANIAATGLKGAARVVLGSAASASPENLAWPADGALPALVVANPPYIPLARPGDPPLQPEVDRWENPLALFAGDALGVRVAAQVVGMAARQAAALKRPVPVWMEVDESHTVELLAAAASDHLSPDLAAVVDVRWRPALLPDLFGRPRFAGATAHPVVHGDR